MKTFFIVCISTLASGVVSAQAGDYNGYGDRQASAFDGGSSQRLYRSGSECGPDHAVPVWGTNNAFLGYSCESESANGN